MRPSDVLAMSAQEIANLQISEILSVLVQIPSVNPLWQSPNSGTANELAKAEFLAKLFRKLGNIVQVDIDYVTPNRPNVMVRINVDTQNWTVWDTHIDTVGVENMTIPPFGGEIRENRVWGRGACDTLASAATAIKLIFSALLQGKKPKMNLLLAFTMGEENGGEGAKAFNPWLIKQGIIVEQWITSEPTMLQAVFAHNGVIRGKLQLFGGGNATIESATSMCFQIKGRSGHTSDPDRSSSALTIAARLILQLEAVLGLYPVAIECGGLGNTIPNSCTLVVEQQTSHFTSRVNLQTEVLNLASRSVRCMDPETAHRKALGVISPTIYSAAKLIIAIAEEHHRLKISPCDAVTGKPVISATGLIGNTGSHFDLFLDRRVVPDEDPATVYTELIDRLRSKISQDEQLAESQVPMMRKQPGFQTDVNSVLISSLSELADTKPTSAKYGTNLLAVDPSVFSNGVINAVVFGPGDIAQAHTVDEFIEIEQLEAHAKIMATFLGFNP